jgi:hypothetical protein
MGLIGRGDLDETIYLSTNSENIGNEILDAPEQVGYG